MWWVGLGDHGDKEQKEVDRMHLHLGEAGVACMECLWFTVAFAKSRVRVADRGIYFQPSRAHQVFCYLRQNHQRYEYNKLALPDVKLKMFLLPFTRTLCLVYNTKNMPERLVWLYKGLSAIHLQRYLPSWTDSVDRQPTNLLNNRHRQLFSSFIASH